jgi:hypothetical protein
MKVVCYIGYIFYLLGYDGLLIMRGKHPLIKISDCGDDVYL